MEVLSCLAQCPILNVCQRCIREDHTKDDILCVSFCRLPEAFNHFSLSFSESDVTSVVFSFMNLFTFP